MLQLDIRTASPPFQDLLYLNYITATWSSKCVHSIGVCCRRNESKSKEDCEFATPIGGEIEFDYHFLILMIVHQLLFLTFQNGHSQVNWHIMHFLVLSIYYHIYVHFSFNSFLSYTQLSACEKINSNGSRSKRRQEPDEYTKSSPASSISTAKPIQQREH